MLGNKPSFSIRMNVQTPNIQGFLNVPTTQPLVKPSVKPPSSLKAPMVQRIFNVRPGCGSCGK